jgi:Ca2+-dependent lipid-binding protein
VLAGRKLAGKNNGKSDPYCEVVVLDDQGSKIGKAQVTKVLKGELNPQWNQLLEL